MPKYRVTVDGHEYLVEVLDPSERPVRAIIEGEILEVTVSSEGEPLQGRAEIAPQPAAPVVTSRPSAPSARPSAQPTRQAALPSNNGSEIKAPLPGTIVGVSVAVGDTVVHGQELCVLEAMKMNNPIRATQAGTVREIRIGIGQQVQHGTVLMVVAEA
jgi:glutaconyl-CoA/methylmalonyl-CoA decarboxylase subunit gamma